MPGTYKACHKVPTRKGNHLHSFVAELNHLRTLTVGELLQISNLILNPFCLSATTGKYMFFPHIEHALKKPPPIIALSSSIFQSSRDSCCLWICLSSHIPEVYHVLLNPICHSAHQAVKTPHLSSLHSLQTELPLGKSFISSSSSDTKHHPEDQRCHPRHFLPASLYKALSCLQHPQPILRLYFPSWWALHSTRQPSHGYLPQRLFTCSLSANG